MNLKITGPVNVEQLPDIFIFHAYGKEVSEQVSFLRFKAKDYLKIKEEMKEPLSRKAIRHRFQDDRSTNPLDSDEFPGFLYLRMNLWRNAPI